MATKTVINTAGMPQKTQQLQHRGISIIIDHQDERQQTPTTQVLLNSKQQQQQQQQSQQQLHQQQKQQQQQQQQKLRQDAPSKIIIQQKGNDEISHTIARGEFLIRESLLQSGEDQCKWEPLNNNNNSNNNSKRVRDVQKPDIEKMLVDIGKSSQIINANGRNVVVVAGDGAGTRAGASADSMNGINITTTTTTTHNVSNGTSSSNDNDVMTNNNTRMIIKCSSNDDDRGGDGVSGGESNGKPEHEESSRVREHSSRDHHHHLAVVTVTGGDSVGECENGQQNRCASIGGGDGGGCVPTTALESISTSKRSDSLTPIVEDCASAVTASCDSQLKEITEQQQPYPHVVTIQINQKQQQQQQREKVEEEAPSNISRNFPGKFDESEKRPQRSIERQVTVVSLNSDTSEETRCSNADFPTQNLTMVHKPNAMATANVNGNGTLNGSGSSSSVTELNVSNNSYLYYMMTSSSGQFSPCDTLDSGTGSDLESNNGNGNGNNAASPPTKITMSTNCLDLKATPIMTKKTTTTTTTTTPSASLEMHLQTTKLRLNNGSKHKSRLLHNHHEDDEHDHDADCDGEDSEECESTSSLSCDSLHSSEFGMRPLSGNVKVAGPTPPSPPSQQLASMKLLSSMLPDSLLRDIRDRKFPANDFVSKYNNHSGGEESHESSASSSESSSAAGDKSPLHDYAHEVEEHVKFLQERDAMESTSSSSLQSSNRSSLPPGKTFILNTENGTFIDTKMNSMPRTYEADKFYNFHVNEHENFRSFGSNSLGVSRRLEDFAEFDMKSLQDDAFAGYKDIRCASGTSTIRSSKGTVRGVKNRVRNGIATFLQMQQPNVKNYKEKDLGKVVLYTTSMGIIRDTYAKCANVKQILRTLLVKFEERDVFMSVEYQQEIKERMHSEIIKVPQLFVEGQHIGDAETVERLNESGELRQLLKPYKSIATIYTCQTCGGYRLLPCPSCNGSKKSVHRNHFTAEFVALKCMNCDEVGLVKCHNC